MTQKKAIRFSAIFAATALMSSPAFFVSGPAAADEVPPTVPEGVTLVEVVRELPLSQPELLWLRPGDANGRTLFVSEADEAGVSNCVGTCAEEFPPLLASAMAAAFGDWTVTQREDGARQWVYQGQPLYTWSKEEEPGVVATNVGLTETANSKLAETAVEAGDLLPPEGWAVARFHPDATILMPDGIEATMVAAAQGVILTDHRGHALYAFDGDVENDGQICTSSGCDVQWPPVMAPALAAPIGDFSIVTRADGTRQWAYKGQPLYSYEGDKLAGDVHGKSVHEDWSVAMLSQNFQPKDVSVADASAYGSVLVLEGMTLYAGHAFEKRWGGRNLRDTFRNAYYRGKELGAAACVDSACLENWRPFYASADAQSNGFWEPVAREDGTKQWAYKGYALYTYSGDKKPGDITGHATYDFAKVGGDPADIQRVAFLAEVGDQDGGAGVYWHIAKP